MFKNKQLHCVLFLWSFISLLCAGENGYGTESVTAMENLEKLIKTNSCKGCYLAGVNLNRVDLSDADLEGADLSKTKMYLTNLSRANLRNADLRGVVFGGADLADADLRGADLRGTSLDGAYLGGTLLDGEFVMTKPYENTGANEIEREVYIDDQSKPKLQPKAKEIVVAPRRVFEEPPPTLPVKEVEEKIKESGERIAKEESYPQPPEVKKLTSLKKLVIEEKSAIKVDTDSSGPDKNSLKGETGDVAPDTRNVASDENIVNPGRGEKNLNLAVDKKKRDNMSRLLDTNRCYDCDLSGMNLSNSNLDGADLEKSDLTGCNLEKADLANANLKGALLIRANLRGANLKNADFYRADLTDADLAGANVENTLFDSTELSGTAGLKNPGILLKK